MDENSYRAQFESLASGLEMEKLYDKLADRADLVRAVVIHCGDIYKAARKAGLPRRTAAAMAKYYFEYETTPAGVYVVGGGEG